MGIYLAHRWRRVRVREGVIIKPIWRVTAQLIVDERGQDLVEYALLSMLIGVLGIAAWQAVAGGIGTAYGDWDNNNQDLWVPDDPVGP